MGKSPIVDKWNTARLTGYHPRDVKTDKQKSVEGPDHDSSGNPLHYFEHYDHNDPKSFVGLAGDVSAFNPGDKIMIKELPSYRFVIMDNGGGFNYKTGLGRFDVPVLTRQKANEITAQYKEVHWKRIIEENPKMVKPSANTDDSSIIPLLILALSYLLR